MSEAITDFKLQWVESRRAGRLALVTIDNGADYTKPTTFGAAALDNLERTLDAVSASDARGLMLTGKPFIFAAGANLEEFVGVDESFARRGGQRGHHLFSRLRDLEIPTLAAINGVCMGGGLEIALHCDRRSLSKNARALAFPEVFLSIVPAWGGTQLAPRLIGGVSALDIVVHNPLNQNRTLRPQQAFQLGLAEWLLEPVDFLEHSLQILEDMANVEESRIPATPAPPPPTADELEEALQRARALAFARVHGATRAPELAIDLIEFAARGGGLAEGLEREEDALAELLPARQAQASVYSFDLTQVRVGRQPWKPAVPGRRIGGVGVIGAGLMGAQLGALFLQKTELPLVMKDIDQGVLESARQHIEGSLDERVAKGRLKAGKAEFLKSIVVYSLEDVALSDCDFIIEAVVENLGLKQKIFAGLEAGVAPECVFATNTSSLSVTAMAGALDHPERLVGFHFFNPVKVLPLVELVRGDGTDDITFATAFEVASQLGKSAVACRDAPAFVVNRLLTRFLAPCLEAATAGTPFEDIDRAIEGLGMPMGPFKLIGLVGPKVALHTAETLHAAFPERFGSDPNLVRLASSDFSGVYGFDGQINEDARGLWQTRGETGLSDEEIQRRALSAAADEAKRMLDAEVVADARDIDTCMILGAGWPFFMGGLCMYLDQTGLSGELFGQRLVGAKDRAS